LATWEARRAFAAYRGIAFEEAELEGVFIPDAMVLVEGGEALRLVDVVRRLKDRLVHQGRPHRRPWPHRCQRRRRARGAAATAQAQDGGEVLRIVAKRAEQVGDRAASKLEQVGAAQVVGRSKHLK
jgi:hypothetical protein